MWAACVFFSSHIKNSETRCFARFCSAVMLAGCALGRKGGSENATIERQQEVALCIPHVPRPGAWRGDSVATQDPVV